jgi:hypothetical protein
MLRHSPLPKRREKPRRNEGRITHQRIKRARVSKTALERIHMDRIGAMPCLGCGRRPVHVHHLMKCPAKRCRRDHRYVAPLCADPNNGCHIGKNGVHKITEKLWGERRGIDLAAWAIEQWAITERNPHA